MKKKGTQVNRSIVVLLAIMTMLSFVSCSPFEGLKQVIIVDEDGESADYVDTGFVVAGPDSFDSADTPILVDINRDDNTVTFLNLDIGKRYTLSMDGTTKLYNKHGESISLDQIQAGDIVDITFLKSQKHLNSMQLSGEAWKYDNVERYEINTIRREVTIGSEVYKLSENTQFLSEGRSIEEMELNPSDVLCFQGIDKTILSVTVEKGHGYLRLINDEKFIGGWIEIGQEHIQKINDNMLLTVPEGSYQVSISHKGGGGTKNVIINRNQETTLDIGDLAVAEVQYGMVLFSLSPANAQLYIDGNEVDASQPISLEYGIHQIIAKADGYKSLTQYLRVGQESAGIDVILEEMEAGENTEDDDSESTTDDDTIDDDDISDYYKVYIEAPEKAEVYYDGNYVGIVPCSFKKQSGTHVITLRRTGYLTRSFTVLIDGEEKDSSYSFADLVEADTVSGS